MATLEFKDLRKSFGAVDVIKGVDLSIEDREFVVFVGPSGCGKSTLLRMVAGLEDITSGELFIGDREVSRVDPAQRKVAMVFQSYALYPHMSVRQNMGFGLKMTGTDKAVVDEKVNAAAKILQLDVLMDRKPKALSGGQRQRVAIGRAIVRDPEVFLFDEPLSNLDAELRVQMRVEIAKLHQQLNATMIYVTHDQTEAMTMADKIVVLRAGLIEQVGSPADLYNNPKNKFVAGFIGSPKMNFVQGKRVKDGLQLAGSDYVASAPDQAAVADGETVTFGIRPEHLVVGSEGLPLKVLVVEFLGGSSFIYCDAPDGEAVVVQAEGDSDVKEGQIIHVTCPQDRVHLFDQHDLRINA